MNDLSDAAYRYIVLQEDPTGSSFCQSMEFGLGLGALSEATCGMCYMQ